MDDSNYWKSKIEAQNHDEIIFIDGSRVELYGNDILQVHGTKILKRGHLADEFDVYLSGFLTEKDTIDFLERII